MTQSYFPPILSACTQVFNLNTGYPPSGND